MRGEGTEGAQGFILDPQFGRPAGYQPIMSINSNYPLPGLGLESRRRCSLERLTSWRRQTARSGQGHEEWLGGAARAPAGLLPNHLLLLANPRPPLRAGCVLGPCAPASCPVLCPSEMFPNAHIPHGLAHIRRRELSALAFPAQPQHFFWATQHYWVPGPYLVLTPPLHGSVSAPH